MINSKSKLASELERLINNQFSGQEIALKFPVESKLLEEFHKAGWKNLDEARSLIKDKNTLLAIDFVENNYW